MTKQRDARAAYPLPTVPAGWARALRPELRQPYFSALQRFLDAEAERDTVLPPAPDVFRALELTPLSNVRVLLLGQDPYPGAGHANGLCFSVRPGSKPPASLRNIFRELHDDVGVRIPAHGALDAWAKRGVLLLNTVLTVRAGQPNSHRGRGWERFTDGVIRAVVAKRTPVAFLLWGAHAQSRAPLIAGGRHIIVAAAHPSPLSAWRGFLGSRPFSRVNAALMAAGAEPMDWSLPDEAAGDV